MKNSRDKKRVDGLECMGSVSFTPQSTGGIYVWQGGSIHPDKHPKGVFFKSLRAFVDYETKLAAHAARTPKAVA